MPRVLVVGAGTMGHGIAQVFALSGHEVALVDSDQAALQSVHERVSANLEILIEHGMVNHEQAQQTRKRIGLHPVLADGASGADFVVESIIENLEAKQAVFQELERLTPGEAILASNTSSLPITQIAQVVANPARVIGTHFINPPYIMPLVEVTKGRTTSEETVERTTSFLTSVGKKPVVIRKDSEGLLGARLYGALVRECFHVVEQGIASPEDIDRLVKYTYGFRLSTMGPFESWDMVGLDVILGASRFLFPKLASSTKPPALLERKVADGELGIKTGKGIHEWPKSRREVWLREKHAELLRGVSAMLLAEGQDGLRKADPAQR